MAIESVCLTPVLRKGMARPVILFRLVRIAGSYGILTACGTAVLVAAKAPPSAATVGLFLPAMILLAYTLLSLFPIAWRPDGGSSHRLRLTYAAGVAGLCLTAWIIAYRQSHAFRTEAEQRKALKDLANWISQQSHAINERTVVIVRESPDPQDQRRLLQSLPYGQAISRASERYRVDGLLVAAVVATEQDADDPARPVTGLMQVPLSVAEAYGAGDISDPEENIKVGSRYLGALLQEFHGDLELALAAYNSSPSVVEQYGGIPPIAETQEYVRKVLALYEEYQRRAKELPQVGS